MARHLLSKSKLLSYRQCPKRLYLELHRPELAVIDQGQHRILAQGNSVGEIARTLYGEGELIRFEGKDWLSAAIVKTASLLAGDLTAPIYEATFQHQGVLVRVDVLLPSPNGLKLIEVKSSTGVKDYHLDDCAVQAWTVSSSGYQLAGVSVATINSKFVYPGAENYQGLLRESCVDSEIEARRAEVPGWVDSAKSTLAGEEPTIAPGAHCNSPFPCPFQSHCIPKDNAGFPVELLPRGGKLVAELRAEGYADLRDVPLDRLKSETHRRVWRITKSGAPELNEVARLAIEALAYPRYYLDFESISFAVPIWPGTRPYENLTLPWFDVHQDVVNYLMNGEQDEQENVGT